LAVSIVRRARTLIERSFALHSAAVTGTASALVLPSATAIASPPPSISARLQREFMTADDLYAFAENARRRASEGGLLYAQAAALYCSQAHPDTRAAIAAMRPDDDETRSAFAAAAHRSDVAMRYLHRCAGFASIDIQAYWRAIKTSAERSDPLLNAYADLESAARVKD
jgi:hypothetical protein